MKFTNYLLPALALGAAAILFAPAEHLLGYVAHHGEELSAENQRDIRVHNNFSDYASNNNTTIHSNWPGADGAELAIWKAAAEWSSEVVGNGTGDPLQTVGGSNANFDICWAGNASDIGSTNENIFSATTGCSSGVLAFCEIPIANGWRIRFCDDSWNWQDGPGNDGSWDIQGIATHEYGHALGLGHSSDGNATMYPYASSPGTSNRSTGNDDRAGLQFLYGVKAASKPRITGVTVVGSTLTISGSNFSAADNEVWFTNYLTTDPGEDPRLRIFGVSSTGGGSQIVMTVPRGAAPGNVLVKQDATGHSTLSNAWPLDIVGTPPDPVPSFTANPTSGIVPILVSFTDQSTGTGLTQWAWDFGDGGTSNTRHPSHQYDTPGTYDVTLTVTGTYGPQTLVKSDYILAEPPLPVASATPRNGAGMNPNIFTSTSLPVLGSSWGSQVHGSAIGATGFVFVFIYAGGMPGTPTTYGELMLDPASAWLFTSLGGIIGTGYSYHFVQVPNDPAFYGAEAAAQAYINNVAPSGQLTNAIDLVIGF
jgi:PKD repeat protein